MNEKININRKFFHRIGLFSLSARLYLSLALYFDRCSLRSCSNTKLYKIIRPNGITFDKKFLLQYFQFQFCLNVT